MNSDEFFPAKTMIQTAFVLYGFLFVGFMACILVIGVYS